MTTRTSHRLRGARACAAVACLAAVALAAADDAQEPQPLRGDAVAELTKEVRTIASPGVPSRLSAWGPDARVVVVGSSGHEQFAPAVVAGAFGAGRFVLLPHDGYFHEASVNQGDTARLFVNAARWFTSPKSPGDVASEEKRRPIVAARGGTLTKVLGDAGFEAHELGRAPLVDELAKCEAVIGVLPDLADADVAALAAYLERGGGVLAAQCAWGWQQIHGGADLSGNPLNRLFARAGAGWTGETLEPTAAAAFAVGGDLPAAVQARDALALLTRAGDGAAASAAPAARRQATATLLDCFEVLPADDTSLRPELARLAKGGVSHVPTPEHPVKRDDDLARLLLAYDLHERFAAPPDHATAHPAAAAFPGAVPANAPRGAIAIAIDPRVPRWHSTGAYAAPGEAITLEIPEAAARAGLELQIGCHTDELWRLDAWPRAPRIVVRVPIRSERTVLASPFGGLVYVDAPAHCRLDAPFDAKLTNVVAAPRFTLGTTTRADWKATLRDAPAPWAELESAKIIVSVPSQTIRALDDPESLMQLWDRVADAAAELVGIPKERASPERYVADVEIAAGYMHSGYPIMTHLDVAAVMADPKRLAAGDWGLFHELGHNHQRGEWTFAGTGEVTNNVICVYILQKVCGVDPAQGHGAIEDAKARTAAYLARGAKFQEWQGDPFLALTVFLQIEAGFGWEAWQRFFASYDALPRAGRPRDDDDKRDRFLIQMSRACGRDLSQLFTTWGIPTREAARASLADLETWLPPDFPQKAPADVFKRSRKNDASDAFFEGAIPRIRLEVAPGELEKLRDDPRRYVRAKLREDDAKVYAEVGIKLKGAAGSFREIDDKPAFTVNFDKFDQGLEFHGLTKIHLNNSVQDDTYLNEWLASDLMNAAGVPAPRFTQARVWLNERDLGVYTLKEGFDHAFLARHFRKASGNLYDCGFCRDVDTPIDPAATGGADAGIQKDSGKGPDDGSDLAALAEACREPDPALRWPRIEKLLDIDAFLTFVAMELMVGHWDGYSLNANNYRMYFEPTTGRACFMPSGMDQVFGDPEASVLDYPNALVADAVLRNPEWRARFRKRLVELLPLFAASQRLEPKIRAAQKRLGAVLRQDDANAATEWDGRVDDLVSRLAAREQSLRAQASEPEPKTITFDKKGVARIFGFAFQSETGEAAGEQVTTANLRAYKITCGAEPCAAAWWKKVMLPKGHYAFQARCRLSKVVANADDPDSGVQLRIAGGARGQARTGTASWAPIRVEFEVLEETRLVELVAELRASKGKAWFELSSLRIARQK